MRMIGRKNTPEKLQHALVHRKRIRMPTEGTVCACEVAHGRADMRMIGRKNTPSKLQHALLHRQRIRMPTELALDLNYGLFAR
jgi:hypothetical protein